MNKSYIYRRMKTKEEVSAALKLTKEAASRKFVTLVLNILQTFKLQFPRPAFTSGQVCSRFPNVLHQLSMPTCRHATTSFRLFSYKFRQDKATEFHYPIKEKQLLGGVMITVMFFLVFLEKKINTRIMARPKLKKEKTLDTCTPLLRLHRPKLKHTQSRYTILRSDGGRHDSIKSILSRNDLPSSSTRPESSTLTHFINTSASQLSHLIPFSLPSFPFPVRPSLS